MTRPRLKSVRNKQRKVHLNPGTSLRNTNPTFTGDKDFLITSTDRDYRLIYGKDQRFARVVSELFGVNYETTYSQLRFIIRNFEHDVKHHKRRRALENSLEYLNYAKRIASRSKFKLKFESRFYTLDKEGVPSKLWPFLSDLRSDDEQRVKHALTLLSLTRICDCDVDNYDISSIINAHWSSGLVPNRVGDFFIKSPRAFNYNSRRFAICWKKVLHSLFPPELLQDRKIRLRDLNEVHLSRRNGPNGHAIASMCNDYIAIHRDNVKDNIIELAEQTDNLNLLDLLEECDRDIKLQRYMSKMTDEGKEFLHSKISLKKGEPYFKERIFAIIDYFSQSSLVGIDKYFRQLSSFNKDSINWDGSMDQSKVKKIVKEWTLKTYPYSKDLTTATDRIPIPLMSEIVIAAFGKEVGQAWLKVMSDRPFWDSINNKFIRYKVGNPMGALSSWRLLHWVQYAIYASCELYVNLVPNELTPRFVVVGDDSATCDSSISQMYDIIMSGVCGVEQSKFKGYNPTMSSDIAFKSAELCKTNFVNGKDISPISPRIILDAIEEPALLTTFVEECKLRGSQISPRIMSRILPQFKHVESSIAVLMDPIWSPEMGYSIEVPYQHSKFHQTYQNINPDRFYEAFLHVCVEDLVKISLRQSAWIRRNIMLDFPSILDDSPKTPLTPVVNIQFDSIREVHYSIIDRLISILNENDNEEDELDIEVSYKEIWMQSHSDRASKLYNILKSKITLDDFDKFLGFGHSKRDEKQKRVLTNYSVASRKAFELSINPDFDAENCKESNRILLSILRKPILSLEESLTELEPCHSSLKEYFDFLKTSSELES